MASTGELAGHETAAWHIITGTARGAVHRAHGLPNQDAVAQQAAGGPGGLVVAVADGHGHERHFRSAAGSALAVDVGCRTATRLAAGLTDDGRAGEMDLAPAIVRDWRAAVAEHLAVHPYTADEQGALDRAGDGPEVPYGSTLLLAMIAGRRLVCAQIGDGDLLAVRPDGHAFYPLPTDSRLDGQHTTSLCQADAVASFRTNTVDLAEVPLLAVLLATDGYANAQAADPWPPPFGRDLAFFAAEHGPEWFEQQVPAWAERCASTDGSADDTTIALLIQPGAARPAVKPDTTVPAVQPDATVPAVQADAAVPAVQPDTARPGGRKARGGRQAAPGRKRLVLTAAAVAVAALAAVLSVLLTPGSGGLPAHPPTVPSSAPHIDQHTNRAAQAPSQHQKGAQ